MLWRISLVWWLGKMCRDLVATHEALTLKSNDILEIETEQRNKLKYRKQ